MVMIVLMILFDILWTNDFSEPDLGKTKVRFGCSFHTTFFSAPTNDGLGLTEMSHEDEAQVQMT